MTNQVKQVGVIQNEWNRFAIFEIGDEQFYLFALLDRRGSVTRLQFPVRKTDLRPEIRSALAHGWGNTYIYD